jgi:hypothetical protein
LSFRQDDGIVVFEVRREDDVQIDAVPLALRARLGSEATAGLLELFDESHKGMREAVIVASAERFERRLVEEISGVRVQIAQVETSIRRDMAEICADLRQEIASGRVELLKWCFVFWVGQVLAVGGLVGVMLRLIR